MKSHIAKKMVVGGFVVAVVLSLFSTPASARNAATTDQPEKRIVVFSLPRVTWDTLQSGSTPNIDSLISQGSVAALSVKVLGAPSLAKSYATLSAGLRATAPDLSTVNFFAPDEETNGQTARKIFQNQRGDIGAKNPVALGLGFETVIRSNAKSLNDARVGLFASTLNSKGKSISVFGNADSCHEDNASCYDRSIGYLGTDINGVVRKGDISRELLVSPNKSTKTQPTLDYTELEKNALSSLDNNDVTVVECSDLERIDADRAKTKSSISDKNFQDALSKCDSLIGKILPSVSMAQDQVYVISPASPHALEQTTVFIAAGQGIARGYASSATTRVQGIVSIVDIAPTILSSLHIERPETMGDTLIDWNKNSASNATRENFLIRVNSQAVAREEVALPTTWFVGLVFVTTILISMIAFSRARKWRFAARFACFVTLSMPVLVYLIQPFMETLNRPVRIISVLGALSLLGAVGLMAIAKKWGTTIAVLAVASFTNAVFILDVLTGGRLQFNSVFGYGTIQAGRFAGWGNSTFAFVGVFSFVMIAMIKQITKDSNEKTTKRVNLAIMLVLLCLIVLDGAPYFGADVGGILALTPTAVIVGMMLYGKRLGFKTIFWAVLATVGTIVVAALVDLARPVSERTHLGRFAESLIHGTAGVIIRRKITASLDSFQRPELTIVVLVSILFVLYLVFNRERYFDKTIQAFPTLKYLIIPGITLAVLGTALNDSGISIPARMLSVALPVITLLALDVCASREEPHAKKDSSPEKVDAV